MWPREQSRVDEGGVLSLVLLISSFSRLCAPWYKETAQYTHQQHSNILVQVSVQLCRYKLAVGEVTAIDRLMARESFLRKLYNYINGNAKVWS